MSSVNICSRLISNVVGSLYLVYGHEDKQSISLTTHQLSLTSLLFFGQENERLIASKTKSHKNQKGLNNRERDLFHAMIVTLDV